MSQLIASDDNNPAFQGAHNPDARLAVRFYSRPVKNAFESEQQGRPIFSDVDFIEISVPGDTLSVIDQPVREDHKKRFPLHWAHYQNTKGAESSVTGTPLTQWSRITPAQAEELRALKFYTVESIAEASDQGIQRIGMIAGMSPYAFREHAQRFLRIAHEDAVAAEAEQRAKVAEESNSALRAEMEKMQAQLAALQQGQQMKKHNQKE